MIIADAKLSNGTALTSGQQAAKAGVGGSLNVKAVPNGGPAKDIFGVNLFFPAESPARDSAWLNAKAGVRGRIV